MASLDPEILKSISSSLKRIADSIEGFLEPKLQDWGKPQEPFGSEHLQGLSEEELWELEQEDLRKQELGQHPGEPSLIDDFIIR